MTQGIGRRGLVILIGDWAALALFVFLGQVDHDVVDVGRWLMQTVALGAPWTLVALALRAHRRPPEATLRAFVGRSLLAWLVAAPLGLLLRALLQGQATIVVAFMLVTLGLGGLLLLLWRALYFHATRRR